MNILPRSAKSTDGQMANLELASRDSAASAKFVTPEAHSLQCPSAAIGVPCVAGGGALVHPQRLSIEPRLGLAWQAMKRGSLRINVGYGTYYNGGIYNSGSSSQSLAQAPAICRRAPGQALQTSTNNVLKPGERA